jgi:CheY-like chemotaxis protein/anti-sigma regulatory factor (Ser/Thr protein kinase)
MLVSIDPETPPVLADATQVEQALLNLCTNAIQAIGTNRGTVSIELSHNLQAGARPVERRGGVRGQHVKLAVRDTGSGIDAETLQRVFEPFFTTKPVGQGTGLGLAVVHGIMRTHQGTVDVQSTPDTGSVFTLYFPVEADTVVAAPVEMPKPKAVHGMGKHVMYVDDDEALVFLVERALTRKGFKVSTFTDPRLAVAALRAHPLDFDLLVTDYNMPGYCGVDLLREARLIRPELPVALASGYVTPEIEQSALNEGARALIHKPNDVDEMCETLQRLLQSSDALS